MNGFRIQIMATGGTLAKRYDARSGELVVDNRIVEQMVDRLTATDAVIAVTSVMSKDSLLMNAADRAAIVAAVREQGPHSEAIIVTHGTDTLAETARALSSALPQLSIPVILTGAMVPDRCADSDAFQNLAQAVMASRLLAPGVHVVFHGRVLPGDRAVKNHDSLTFEIDPDADHA